MHRLPVPLLLASFLFASSIAGSRTPVEPPRKSLRIPDGQKLLFLATARGVQIYAAKASANHPTELEWVLDGPSATLYDSSGAQIGRHEKGPIWTANDGSKARGKLVESVPSPSLTSIPWLLLSAKPDSAAGQMSKVSYVMRVETSGGPPPKQPPRRLDAKASVPYQATYIFLGPA